MKHQKKYCLTSGCLKCHCDECETVRNADRGLQVKFLGKGATHMWFYPHNFPTPFVTLLMWKIIETEEKE